MTRVWQSRWSLKCSEQCRRVRQRSRAGGELEVLKQRPRHGREMPACKDAQSRRGGHRQGMSAKHPAPRQSFHPIHRPPPIEAAAAAARLLQARAAGRHQGHAHPAAHCRPLLARWPPFRGAVGGGARGGGALLRRGQPLAGTGEALPPPGRLAAIDQGRCRCA